MADGLGKSSVAEYIERAQRAGLACAASSSCCRSKGVDLSTKQPFDDSRLTLCASKAHGSRSVTSRCRAHSSKTLDESMGSCIRPRVEVGVAELNVVDSVLEHVVRRGQDLVGDGDRVRCCAKARHEVPDSARRYVSFLRPAQTPACTSAVTKWTLPCVQTRASSCLRTADCRGRRSPTHRVVM
jgi:hypothetical protein